MFKWQALLLLGCVGCADNTVSQRVDQCRDVVGFWSAEHSDMRHEVTVTKQSVTVDLSLKIQVALGEQQGHGSCVYPISESGKVSEKPSRIVIGATELVREKDIADALAMNKDFDIPDHDH